MKYPLIDETTQSASPLRDNDQSKILYEMEEKPWVLDPGIRIKTLMLLHFNLPTFRWTPWAMMRSPGLPNGLDQGKNPEHMQKNSHSEAKIAHVWCVILEGFAKWQAKSSKFNCWSVALQSGTGEISSSKWFLVVLQLSYGSTLKIVMSDILDHDRLSF